MTSIKDSLLDIIFPRQCLGCDILLGSEILSYICHTCLKAVPLAQGFACAFCKSPVRAGKTCIYCIKKYSLDRLLAATSYENPLVKKIIKTVKFRFVKSLAVDVADLMAKYIKRKAAWLTNNESALVVSVPLHRRRLNWRGFNQAEVIATKIAALFNRPLIVNMLKRRHNRKPQTDMPNRASRLQNAQNLFEVFPAYRSLASIDYVQPRLSPTKRAKSITYRSLASIDLAPIDYRQIEQDGQNGVTGKTILLIDDISTTGSTLNDCARALKSAGAKEVIGFVFARGKLDGQQK